MKYISSLFLFLLVGCFCHAQQFQKIGQTAVEGCYWDLEGNKHAGKLKVYCSTSLGSGTYIKYYVDGKKKGKLYEGDMKSFVIGADSFALIHNFSSGNLTNYSSDFAKVIHTGKINLYRHYRKVTQSYGLNSIPSSVLTNTYIIQKEATKTFYGIFNKKKCRDYFLPMIADYPELYEEVLAMKPKERFNSLWSLVKEYNDFKRDNP